MPVRHVAMFRFAEGVDPRRIDALEAALGELPRRIGELESYSFGRALGLSEPSWDFVVVADVADAEAYERYRTHPDHVALIREHLEPILADRAAVQIQR